MISQFYCLTSISPKDNSQFGGLHRKVWNKERVLLKFLKLTFGSRPMHIISNSEFNSKLEQTSFFFLLFCFFPFFQYSWLAYFIVNTIAFIVIITVTSFVHVIFGQSVVAFWKTCRK